MPAYYFIKLGLGGKWESESIRDGLLRFGWAGQTLDDINAGRWARIADQLSEGGARKKGPVTNEVNRLKDIVGSKADDVWITFHRARLWWTHLQDGDVEADGVSKFRRTSGWSDQSRLGRTLFTVELPGALSAAQGFRGTVCAVKHVQLLESVLSGESTPLRRELSDAKEALEGVVARAIGLLHWKDFETLTDLVFRSAGWIRLSVLGETQKSFDFELQEPITGDRYAVQVKSKADRSDLDNTLDGFDANHFKRLFFVIHSPATSLLVDDAYPEFVDLVLPHQLSKLAVSAGLVQWILDRVA